MRVLGGKYASLLPAVDASMQTSLQSGCSDDELSVMTRIEQLQTSDGASEQMWLKSMEVPIEKEPAHSCSCLVRGKLDTRWLKLVVKQNDAQSSLSVSCFS